MDPNRNESVKTGVAMGGNSPDRPSVTNSSVVVPQNGLQFETGLLVTHTQGQFVLDLPETSVRYGLLSKNRASSHSSRLPLQSPR